MDPQSKSTPADVPDSDMIGMFAAADQIDLLESSFSSVHDLYIAIPGIDHWLWLPNVLPLLSITPQMLRVAFNCPHWVPGKSKGRRRYAIGEPILVDELPDKIDTYSQLGSLSFDPLQLQKLAVVFGKTIRLVKRDGSQTNQYVLSLTIPPEGEIIDHLH